MDLLIRMTGRSSWDCSILSVEPVGYKVEVRQQSIKVIHDSKIVASLEGKILTIEGNEWHFSRTKWWKSWRNLYVIEREGNQVELKPIAEKKWISLLRKYRIQSKGLILADIEYSNSDEIENQTLAVKRKTGQFSIEISILCAVLWQESNQALA